MSSIEAMVASARELATGSLRVTGLPSLVSTVQDRDELLEAIRVGRADAAAGVIDRVPDDLAAMPLPSQEFAAVLPSAGPDSARHPDRSLTARDLSERTLVTLPPGASIRQL